MNWFQSHLTFFVGFWCLWLRYTWLRSSFSASSGRYLRRERRRSQVAYQDRRICFFFILICTAFFQQIFIDDTPSKTFDLCWWHTFRYRSLLMTPLQMSIFVDDTSLNIDLCWRHPLQMSIFVDDTPSNLDLCWSHPFKCRFLLMTPL